MVSPAEKFQKQLLEISRSSFIEEPLSETVAKAFMATPRHLFVKRYRLPFAKEWCEVDEKNLEEHLATIYKDGSMILIGEKDEEVPSTISQPSLVMKMIDMLKLEPGHRVFELGAGSGWNAALMGHVVGPEGHVYSLEIIPEMVKRASKAIASLGIKNVSIIEADAGRGYAGGAPYDRAIFTAGTYDLPRSFFEQIKDGGLLLVVIKNEGGGDTLFLLEKTGGHFESINSSPCAFVPVTGEYRMEGLDPVYLESLPDWGELKEREVSRIPFWWGGKGPWLLWRTLAIRSFLSITDPLFQPFKAEKTDKHDFVQHFFGLWDRENGSLVITRDDYLISYGNNLAKDRLIRDIKHWVDLGMPGPDSFKLKIYPIEEKLAAGDNQWITKRKDSQFLWGLES